MSLPADPYKPMTASQMPRIFQEAENIKRRTATDYPQRFRVWLESAEGQDWSGRLQTDAALFFRFEQWLLTHEGRHWLAVAEAKTIVKSWQPAPGLITPQMPEAPQSLPIITPHDIRDLPPSITEDDKPVDRRFVAERLKKLAAEKPLATAELPEIFRKALEYRWIQPSSLYLERFKAWEANETSRNWRQRLSEDPRGRVRFAKWLRTPDGEHWQRVMGEGVRETSVLEMMNSCQNFLKSLKEFLPQIENPD